MGTLAQSITLSGRPHGIATGPGGAVVISQIDGGTIAWGTVTATTLTLSGSASVGSLPAHVALHPDGGQAFTANQGANTLSVVDADATTSHADIPLGSGGFNLLASPNGTSVYVTTETGDVHLVDLGSLAVIATVNVGGAANGLALDPVAARLYVSSVEAHTVTAINTIVHQVDRVYEVSDMPQRLALSADRSTLYIASESVGLEALNLSTGDRIAYPGVGPLAVGLSVSPDHEVLYLTRPPVNELVIFDLASHTVTGRIQGLARPRNIAFALNGAVAIVTGEGNQVHIIR